ncbi:MAG: SUF system Fe-S cluster assembly protein [Acidobacteria bacterium]|nr:SUF system Fe-S cluster assembly protein [Acidobacteriota bacterium]
MEEQTKSAETSKAPIGDSGPPDTIRSKVIEALQKVFDPEIPVNIYELGLIYLIECDPDGSVYIRMTLTSPACPVAGTLPPEVETRVREVDGVKSVKVDLVWEPPWEPGKMTEAARLQLGM